MSKFGVLLMLVWLSVSQVLSSAIPIDHHSHEQFRNVDEDVIVCTDKFDRVGDHCYHFSSTRATFNDASIDCHSLGATLAHPNNWPENLQLTRYLRRNLKSTNVYRDGWRSWWIGATDRDKEGRWVWAHDNTPVDYTYWLSGEPNNAHENEHCAQYSRYQWVDSPCENKYQYICQYVELNDYSRIIANGDGKLEETIPSTTTTTAAPLTVSKSDFIQLGEHSYYFSTTKATWHQAYKACHSIDTQLAHPCNSEESSKLTQYLLENRRRDIVWWIGATDRDHEGQWVWSHDNTPVNYTDWRNGEPNNAYGNEHCAHLRIKIVFYNINYDWNDAPCNNKYNFICQSENLRDESQELSSSAENLEALETKYCVPNTAVATGNDPQFNFTKVGDHCYYFSSAKASFDDAHKACNSLGADLAHPNSEEENSQLTDYLRNKFDYYTHMRMWWIGATDRDSEGEWVWAHDKSPVGYTDWESEQPDDSYANEHCAVLHEMYWEYKWFDTFCRYIFQYICQYPNLKINSRQLHPSNTDQVLASAATNIGFAWNTVVITCVVVTCNLLPTVTLRFSHL